MLGDEARLLSVEGAEISGSNAWAVGGARTASGQPLVAGDPHRVIEQPGIYQQVRLACDDPDDPFDVVGFTFVGVPGVQHFAHAGPVAWAITNGMADYQDVHDEAVPPADVVEQRTETITVRGAAPVTVEVVRTAHGVVFDDGLSLRDPATETGDVGFEALLPLLRARTVDDVDRALDRWVVPVNNVVVADTSGAVRYRLAGLVPTRAADGSWTGWLDADATGRHDVPPDGQVVTANERRGPESDLVGRRVRGALPRPPDPRAARRPHRPHGRPTWRRSTATTCSAPCPALTALVPGAFDDFDGRMTAGSPAAGRFAAWRTGLVRRIVAQPVFAGVRDPAPEHRHSSVFAPWLDLTHTVASSLPSLVAAGTPFGIDLAGLARAALAEVDAAGPSLTWGDTHVAAPVHAFETLGLPAPALPAPPVSGDSNCVCATASYPAATDECSRGPVARYVWDLADRQASGWAVPTGADGRPGTPHHHDQLDAWATATLLPVVTDWERLTPGPAVSCFSNHASAYGLSL